MNTQAQIDAYLQSVNELQKADLLLLSDLLSNNFINPILSFNTGIDENGKRVSNPSIGFGQYNHVFSNGVSKKLFQVGISANTGGISIYLLGLPKTSNLKSTFGAALGQAQITGYCIKFKSTRKINTECLIEGINQLYKAAASS